MSYPLVSKGSMYCPYCGRDHFIKKKYLVSDTKSGGTEVFNYACKYSCTLFGYSFPDDCVDSEEFCSVCYGGMVVCSGRAENRKRVY